MMTVSGFTGFTCPVDLDVTIWGTGAVAGPFPVALFWIPIFISVTAVGISAILSIYVFSIVALTVVTM